MKKIIITVALIAATITVKAQAKPDTTVIVKIKDFRKMAEIITEYSNRLPDAQKLLIEIDMKYILNRIVLEMDTNKKAIKKPGTK
jgi:hypothetical protein